MLVTIGRPISPGFGSVQVRKIITMCIFAITASALHAHAQNTNDVVPESSATRHLEFVQVSQASMKWKAFQIAMNKASSAEQMNNAHAFIYSDQAEDPSQTRGLDALSCAPVGLLSRPQQLCHHLVPCLATLS